jgi:GDP-L-fucose synthase
MADASIHILENVSFVDLKGGSPEIRNCHINIGTGKEISIKDLAYIIKDEIKYNGEIHWDNTKPDGTMRKLCDVSKLHSLGWKHTIEIGEGIHRLYSWYISQ